MTKPGLLHHRLVALAIHLHRLYEAAAFFSLAARHEKHAHRFRPDNASIWIDLSEDTYPAELLGASVEIAPGLILRDGGILYVTFCRLKAERLPEGALSFDYQDVQSGHHPSPLC